MPTSSAAVSSLALAVLGVGAVSAFAQGQTVAAFEGRQDAARPAVALPAPPPGPIESRLLAFPQRSDGQPMPETAPPPALFGGALPVITVIDRRKSKGKSPAPGTGTETELVITINPAPFGTPAPPPDDPAPPEKTVAAVAPDLGPATPPPTKAPLAASIPFVGRSPDLTEATRTTLDGVGKTLADKRPRLVEVRAFATGDDIVSRQISLARALVVRAYLIDRGVKSRIDVGAFLGDDERVDILVPNT
ncbi:MAG TPA: OmpA family protein [Reyranella sp.]|jgi:outer membrane protein OmpA-like peptidoglycan-associated protein